MMKRPRLMLVLLSVSVLAALAPLAQAEEPRREMHSREGQVDFHGREIRHFNEHELTIWRGGRWHHEWHSGRFGWWWEVAGVWYHYDAPVYPYPTFVPAVVVQPAQIQREVVYPYGKYVLYGDGVTQPWQWVWMPASSPPPPPPLPPSAPAGAAPPVPPPPPTAAAPSPSLPQAKQ